MQKRTDSVLYCARWVSRASVHALSVLPGPAGWRRQQMTAWRNLPAAACLLTLLLDVAFSQRLVAPIFSKVSASSNTGLLNVTLIFDDFLGMFEGVYTLKAGARRCASRLSQRTCLRLCLHSLGAVVFDTTNMHR